jgi:hypothetical protein
VVAAGPDASRSRAGDVLVGGGVDHDRGLGEFDGSERDVVAVYCVPVGDAVPVGQVDAVVSQGCLLV